MSKLVWDKGRESRLATAWNAGVPASLLGERFGTSAAAIIEKIAALRARGVDLRYDPSALENTRRRQVRRLRLYTVLPIAERRHKAALGVCEPK